MSLHELPRSFAASVARHAFEDAAAINDHFERKFGLEFPAWFRTACGGRGAWRERNIPADADANFALAWNNTRQIFGGPASFFQFVCLASIIINETGGTFAPISERYGRRGHPGIAYLFDAIAGVKQSYNKAPNVPAGKLFNDRDFIAAHGDLPPAPRLKNTSDARWNGQAYPQGEFSTSDRPAETGFIMETDFFKFRGRGLIQTTFRGNYLKTAAPVLLGRSIDGMTSAQREQFFRDNQTELNAALDALDDRELARRCLHDANLAYGMVKHFVYKDPSTFRRVNDTPPDFSYWGALIGGSRASGTEMVSGLRPGIGPLHRQGYGEFVQWRATEILARIQESGLPIRCM